MPDEKIVPLFDRPESCSCGWQGRYGQLGLIQNARDGRVTDIVCPKCRRSDGLTPVVEMPQHWQDALNE